MRKTFRELRRKKRQATDSPGWRAESKELQAKREQNRNKRRAESRGKRAESWS
jgi:hypothetical protein